MSQPRQETEPGGITYDRLQLMDVQTRLVGRFGIRRVLEMDAGGAKARPSIYSLGFALAGCEVDLVDGDESALEDFRALGVEHRVRFLTRDDLADHEPRWDLAWNFVTLSADLDFPRHIRRMSHLASLVMTVHCNGLHLGRPWHRMLHAMFRIPWNHGRWEAEFPGTVGLTYRGAGLETAACGFFDAPGWPDPPGFRDIRLHLGHVTGDERNVTWRAPVIDILRTGHVPTLLRMLQVQERYQPLPVKAVLAHLYYHLGRKV